MAVRREIPEHDGIYFITITCGEWLHLFEQANAHDAVYKWFDHLKGRGHFIVGYVIMPNHLHALIAFRNTMGESINGIIGSGKRFRPRRVSRFGDSALPTPNLNKKQASARSRLPRNKEHIHVIRSRSIFPAWQFEGRFLSMTVSISSR